MEMQRRNFIKFAILVAIAAIISAILSFLSIRFGPTKLAPEKEVKIEKEIIKLPPPKLKGEISVEEAILRRRSRRRYLEEPLRIEDLSNLLWSAQAITDPVNKFRAAPSAGATYPLEVYVTIKRDGVTGLAEGLYRYNPFEHILEKQFSGDLSDDLSFTALGQEWVKEAPINIVLVAVYERTTRRYGERGIRYVHMEVGHVGENIYLQAESLGLGTVVIGAFYDEQVKKLLKLPEDQKPLYIIPVGKVR
jgi:SagB-type dehydrogenase family enzyme